MAEESITKLESVIAGIRGYIGEQLGELESELGAARGAVTALGEQLVARQASIETLEASRELLVAKLGELEGAVAETKAFAQARESREEAGDAVAAEIVAAVSGDAVVGALPTGTAAGGTGTGKLTAGQLEVLSFLEATPGVHKVAEIASAVNGGNAGNAALQAVRRALGVLTEAGLAVKSTQSGTAFYSANTDAAPAAPAAPEQAPAKKAPAAKAPARKAAAKKATTKAAKAPAKAAPKKAAKAPVKEAATEAAAAVTEAVTATDEKSAPVRARKSTAKKTADKPAVKAADKTVADKPVAKKAPAKKAPAKKTVTASAGKGKATDSATAAEKSVRADRTKIVATLLASSEPQSAGEVSRTVMGNEWKSSDATNFRNVLKSMVAEGVIAEHLGENNRARYTVAASS